MNREFIQAFILKMTPYSDSDLILTYLSQEGEKRKAFAKKAKGSKKRFGGCLDNFNLVEFDLKKASRDDQLDLIYGADLRFSNTSLRNDLALFAWISVLSEMIVELHPQDEKYPQIFEFFNKIIKDKNSISSQLYTLFSLRVYEILDHLGYNPNFDHCFQCSTAIASNRSYHFLPHEGAMICSCCRSHSSIKNYLNMKGDDILAFNKMRKDVNYFDSLSSDFTASFIKVLDQLMIHILHRPLASIRFLSSLS